MAALFRSTRIMKDSSGDAVVEAVILFPIMIMIFAALVLLAIYLPTRGALQRATQYAATAISTDSSDTWLYFDKESLTFKWETGKDRLENVYVALFSGISDVQSRGEEIVSRVEGRSLNSKAGVLTVDSLVINKIVYKEVVVTATREYTVPVDLSFISMPRTIRVTATSTAVVQNGDEFVRTIDMADDFVKFITEKFGLSDVADAIGSFGASISSIFGW